jgi:hypothetical protein
MKHATSRMLFAYWDALRRERAAPDRADIQPGALRHVLADVFILELEADQPALFRLAGTRCAALFGRDLRGAAFTSLWQADRREEAAGYLQTVTSETVGMVLGLTAHAESGAEVGLELLLLPLRYQARPHARVLGALSPACTPSWAGLVPVTHVETRTRRVIIPNRLLRASGPERDRAASVERRRGLVVVEGGRA